MHPPASKDTGEREEPYTHSRPRAKAETGAWARSSELTPTKAEEGVSEAPAGEEPSSSLNRGPPELKSRRL